MSVPDLLVLGDVNPDLILSGGDVEPAFGQAERLVEHATLVLGGSGAIAACSAARLGLSVAMCGVVGEDELGARCLGWLTQAGVETSRVRVDPGTPTGVTVILARGEDRASITAPGAIGQLDDGDLEVLPDRPARHVHVASIFLMGGRFRAELPRALRRFRGAGVTTSLDPNWDPSGRWELDDLMSELDVLLPNEAELSALTGGMGIDEALRWLGRRTTVAVKLGVDGGATLRDGRVVRVRAPGSAAFADSVGAGDSFDGGYLAGMLAGADPAEALALGVAAGTLSTRAVGGTSGQPTMDEVQRVRTTIA